jgi:photosystem II stability/assembly factor-like uncharacterized protein
VAKKKTGRRPPKRRPAEARKQAAPPRRRYTWLTWIAIVALAAGGAFWLAKRQAEGPREAVAPPPSGLPDTPDYHSLLVDPADPNRLFLGTHVGLYESTDGGRRWRFAELEGQDAMNLARASERFVWTAGHNVLAKSTDAGATWTDVRPEGLPSLDIHGFAVDPDAPERLYAAVANEGLYVSTDAGVSFSLVSREVGPGVYGLAIVPDGRILAADPRRGLLVSNDAGKSWETSLRESIVGVAVNPDPNTIVATGPGIFRSSDGGRTWKLVRPVPQGTGPVAWSSNGGVGYVVGFDRRLYRTADSGLTWKAVGTP